MLCEHVLDKLLPTVIILGEGTSNSSLCTNPAAQEQFDCRDTFHTRLTLVGGEPGESLLPLVTVSLPSNSTNILRQLTHDIDSSV